jgi:hypothetical protein
MKKLIFLAVMILTVLNLFAQTGDLIGWKGTPVIPLSDFTDPGRWNPNASLGSHCYVTKDPADTASICLHWKFSTAAGYKYAQIYFVFDIPVSLSDRDIYGLDIKGQSFNDNCSHNLDVGIKFESLTSASNATYKWHNLGRIDRWCENISALKKQFQVNSVDWNNIKVVSIELNSDSNFSVADSGIIYIRGLKSDNSATWQKATDLTLLNNSPEELKNASEAALDTIRNRQAPTGLLYTWREDGSSWLYGQGLALKILSLAGWDHVNPDSLIYQTAAKKLATFLVTNQHSTGYWPRAWRTSTGQILIDLESDGSVWLGDFPWVITGLSNYYKKTRDPAVFNSINKARRFLTDSLIDPNGRLNTLQKTAQGKYVKREVTSVEAYNAVTLALLELNDSTRAVSISKYIDAATWDNTLKYWNESTGNPRVVLFANTWFSQLITNNKSISDAIDPSLSKSKAALSFVSRILYTKGPGKPTGFDGIGPVATWIEGTLSYITAGGPGTQSVFDSLAAYISPGWAVPHYNDVISCDIGGIWAVKWISLDGTSWLWYAASQSSPFKVLPDSSLKFPVQISGTVEERYKLYPNPARTRLTIEIPDDNNERQITLYNINGVVMLTQKAYNGRTEIDISWLKTGIYFAKIETGTRVKILSFVRGN